MEKAASPQANNKLPDCSFCCNPSAQVKVLLKTAFLRIRNLLLKHKYCEGWELQNGTVEAASGIHRLIRVLFERHQFELKSSKCCSHQRLKSLLREKLRCKPEHLEFAIEEFCDKLARRNYELELISQQVKNIESSVQQIQDFKQTSTKTRKQSQSSQEEEPLPATSHLVKIEQAGLLSSPGVNMVLGCGATQGLPFGYNIVYYGMPYFQ